MTRQLEISRMARMRVNFDAAALAVAAGRRYAIDAIVSAVCLEVSTVIAWRSLMAARRRHRANNWAARS